MERIVSTVHKKGLICEFAIANNIRSTMVDCFTPDVTWGLKDVTWTYFTCNHHRDGLQLFDTFAKLVNRCFLSEENSFLNHETRRPRFLLARPLFPGSGNKWTVLSWAKKQFPGRRRRRPLFPEARNASTAVSFADFFFLQGHNFLSQETCQPLFPEPGNNFLSKETISGTRKHVDRCSLNQGTVCWNRKQFPEPVNTATLVSRARKQFPERGNMSTAVSWARKQFLEPGNTSTVVSWARKHFNRCFLR